MKQLAVLLVFSSLFTTVIVKGPNKLIQIQIQNKKINLTVCAPRTQKSWETLA